MINIEAHHLSKLNDGAGETAIPFPRTDLQKSLTERFEEQVTRFPQRLAVKHGNQELTYQQLDQSANGVAKVIREYDPKSTTPIALLFHSDVAMIIAILGVLKAGRYCVPLDPSHPKFRNRMIIEETQPELLITTTEQISTAGELIPDFTHILSLDEISPTTSQSSLPIVNQPNSLAFVLFTSGTTGKPKGVVITHRFLMHLVMYHTNTRKICPKDRFSSLTRCHHIGGISDVFRALLNGASLFPFDLRTESMNDLIHWIINERITILHCVPTIYRALFDLLPNGEALPCLRLIHLGGEPVTKRDIERYQERFSKTCILVNNFGSSETGPLGQYFVYQDTQISGKIVPIELQVEDKDIFLIDSSPAPNGDGVIGEIAVRSQFLSPGYWSGPNKDINKLFVEQADARRTFRTGDLGRMRKDGRLIYVGRKDHQVNIRGFRVDLSEIEATIRTLSICKDVVVLPRQIEEDLTQLVAYWVPEEGVIADVSVLRDNLAQWLPGYMIPEKFFFLNSLPRTATGKVDRQNLTSQTFDHGSEPNEVLDPRNDLEEGLVKIWKEFLKVPRLGVRNKFMDVGGNSLIATRMANRIADWIGIRLSLTDLFTHTTVEDLADHITRTYS